MRQLYERHPQGGVPDECRWREVLEDEGVLRERKHGEFELSFGAGGGEGRWKEMKEESQESDELVSRKEELV